MVTLSRILGLKNPMDREAWLATVHRVVKSQTGLKRPRRHMLSVLHMRVPVGPTEPRELKFNMWMMHGS